MLLGHYGPAVWDTKRGQAVPIVKLWEAFLAVQAMDVIAAILLIVGLESTSVNVDNAPIAIAPWSHSLVSALVISALISIGYKIVRRPATFRPLLVIATLVFSHWVLDLVVHRPDLPLYPSGELLLGFALWDFPLVAFAVEAGMVFAAFVFWQRVTTPKNGFYNYAVWVLFLLMVGVHYVLIVNVGLQVHSGTFDASRMPPDHVIGTTFLVIIGLFTLLIGLIERGRPSTSIKPS